MRILACIIAHKYAHWYATTYVTYQGSGPRYGVSWFQLYQIMYDSVFSKTKRLLGASDEQAN